VSSCLIRAGHSVESAWDLILGCHPQAMSKARQDKRWWINHAWNPQVLATEHETGPRSAPSPRVAAAIGAAELCLDELLWTVPSVRSRAGVWAVAQAVFARMARQDQLRVPCAERDLVQDVAGITTRRPIRAALRLLHGHVGILHTDTFNPADPYSGYEFEICELPDHDAMVGEKDPPVLTSPRLPGGPQEVRARLLHSVLARADETGMTVSELGWAGYQTTSPVDELTVDQVRGLRQVLTGLAGSGWVACDAQGRWRATVPDPMSERVQRERAEAAATHDRVVDQVHVERADYRRCAAVVWAATRRAVVDAVHARYRAWWAGLSSHQRADRAAAASQRFRDLPAVEQAKARHEWVTRRRGTPASEAARHRAWQASLTPAEYERRREDRRDWYYAQPPQRRVELVRMWDAHRTRHGPAAGMSTLVAT